MKKVVVHTLSVMGGKLLSHWVHISNCTYLVLVRVSAFLIISDRVPLCFLM